MLKTNKSLKLLLVDKKENNSIFMRLEMAGMAENKLKMSYFPFILKVETSNNER